MSEKIRYGFVLFCDIKDPDNKQRPAYIGDSYIYSTNKKEKAKGNIKFLPKQLMDASGIDAGKLGMYVATRILVVRYTLGSANWVTKVELVNQFLKKDYVGKIWVTKDKKVMFRPEDSQEDLLLLNEEDMEAHDKLESTFENQTTIVGPAGEYSKANIISSLELGIDIPDITVKIGKNKLDSAIAIITIPYNTMTVDGDDAQIGIVSYFSNGVSVFVRSGYYNKNYLTTNEESHKVAMFSPSEADIGEIGAIVTGKNVYFVRYRLRGAKVPNPQNIDELLDKAEDVVFIAKIPHKRLISITPEMEGFVVVLTVEGWSQAKAQQDNITISMSFPGPEEGQTIESYLNKITTSSLRNGTTALALEELKKYENIANSQSYFNNRVRLLQSLYKEVDDGARKEEIREDIIICLDNLIAMTPKVGYKLTLLLDKGKKQLQGEDFENAKVTYQSWMNLYKNHISEDPTAEAGLKSSLQQVSNGLLLCGGGVKLTEEYRADHDDEVEYYREDELDEFIVDYMNLHPFIYADGDTEKKEIYAGFENLTNLREEDAPVLRDYILSIYDFDESKDQSADAGGGLSIENKKDRDRAWAIERAYYNLDMSPIDVLSMQEEEQLRRDRDSRISLLLKAEAKAVVNDVFREKSEAFMYSAAGLSLFVDRKSILMAVGSLCLTKEQYQGVIDDKLSFTDVLECAQNTQNGDLTHEIAVSLVELCYRNRSVANELVEMMGMLPQDLLEAYTYEWQGLADSDTPFPQVLNEAMEAFGRFVGKLQKVSNTDNLSEFVDYFKSLIDKDKYRKWMKMEKKSLSPERLKELFISLDGAEENKGFKAQSNVLTSAIGKVKNLFQISQSHPSMLTVYYYQPVLSILSGILSSTYSKLCQTTIPQFTINRDAIAAEKLADGQVCITVPVVSSSKGVQDATEVHMKVKSNPLYACQTDVLVRGSIPGDGSTTNVSFNIKLRNQNAADDRMVPIGIRLEYRYIGEVAIKKSRNYRGNRRRTFYEAEPQTRISEYPSATAADPWYSFEISTKEKVNARELTMDRIDQFAEGGSIDTKNPGVLRILQNREEDIEKAMNTLTSGEMLREDGVRPLNMKGRWVMLYGQWRVGKTVILNCIESRLNDNEQKTTYPNAIILKPDITKYDHDNYEDYVASMIMAELAKEMKPGKIVPKLKRDDPRRLRYPEEYPIIFKDLCDYYKIDLLEPHMTWDSMCRFISEFLEELRAEFEDAVIILLVDEFTKIYQSILAGKCGESFLHSWAELVTKTNILCVTAGGEHTVSMMDTYAPNTLQKAEQRIYVKYLTKENVKDYVRYVMAESDEDMTSPEESYFNSNSDNAIDRIYELTQGNAFLLRQFCMKMIEYINKNKKPFLTKHVVDETLDYIVSSEGIDISSMETVLFNSLFNPFNEAPTSEASETTGSIRRIEDDQVKEDNLQILHKIVDLAHRENHKCVFADLEDMLKPELGEERFNRRINTLLTRHIIQNDNNGNVSVVIDMYYEIVYRIRKGIANE